MQNVKHTRENGPNKECHGPSGRSDTVRELQGPRKAVAAALKPIDQAANENAALEALETFTASEFGRRYPSAVKTFQDAWDRFTPFLAFPPELRRVIYTTNAIESLNYQLRKIAKNRGHFPNDQAAVKLLWLAICNITTNWKQALEQLALAYPERIKTPTSNHPNPNRLHRKLDKQADERSRLMINAGSKWCRNVAKSCAFLHQTMNQCG